jgi:hypothetical protein
MYSTESRLHKKIKGITDLKHGFIRFGNFWSIVLLPFTFITQ